MFGEHALTTVAAFLGGGATWRAWEFFYGVWRSRNDEKRKRTSLNETLLDPLVKSADQLTAKLRALGERDFTDLTNGSADESLDDLVERLNIAYLVLHFWAQIEILRATGSFWELGRDKRGRQLQSFLRCLESRDVRLVTRAMQRALGESVVTDSRTVIPFYDFVEEYRRDENRQRWLRGLFAKFDATRTGSRRNQRKARQQWLQYGVILHALVDTLDEQHHVSRDRPGIPNKLSDRTKRDLRNRVFKLYLTDVTHRGKYLAARGNGHRPAGS